jgi:acetate kinase
VNVFVLNPGSSSLKFGLYPFPEGSAEAITGEMEHLGTDGVVRATGEALTQCRGRGIEAVGCRVVHGGSRFSAPALIDDAVLEQIRSLSDLAPLHNPVAVQVIEEVRRSLPAVPVVAVFDTAFHHAIPAVAWRYAVPEEVPIRRYGFHGISYAWITNRLTEHLGAGKRLILCHLGNGASICAVKDGRSVDTSMGLTPMEGLMMGTRSGDLDPGGLLYLLRAGRSEAELDELLNRRSGLLGVSGRSADMQEVQKAAAAGDERAALALDLFSYRVTKYIGAYAAALGGVDALAFSAGIGEHSAVVRERVCAQLGFLGIELDSAANHAPAKGERRISRGAVPVLVIPTNEELQIARETQSVLLPS